MKIRTLFLAALALCLIALTACNDDDFFADNPCVKETFDQKYPHATQIAWKCIDQYWVAEFRDTDHEKEAWFQIYGTWVLTEVDLSYLQLPVSIRTAFLKSPYARWKIEDIDKLERPIAQPLFILEVEKDHLETDLYYSVDGYLLREETETEHGTRFPTCVPQTILATIQKMYPGAQILEVYSDIQSIEVYIFCNKQHKEVFFDVLSNWMYTKWEIPPAQLPEKILSTLNNSAYATYQIDEAEVIEKGRSVYYHLELQKDEVEVDLYFNENGEIITPIS